ncbi:hypothetical protein G6F70_008397 [Rhizopus microsporus]|nr:hypothetical protein G6F71_003912 [Rhizopus microsporus]KAG1195226.1 hypothetical protein G6F70_008397 [Rhizopus microsporus]KAG1207706.1 hypothetical protein G6F69_007824 [Rhizopus microsporus]KAG1228611.1 hypothetical protein G6F67_007709 [Rhizopus microsporus]KAG1261021.1 hypothetical protein G6F68_006997 [Rhizopus microsporus]
MITSYFIPVNWTSLGLGRGIGNVTLRSGNVGNAPKKALVALAYFLVHIDPSNLRDLDYDDWDEANRTSTARGLFLCRIFTLSNTLKILPSRL